MDGYKTRLSICRPLLTSCSPFKVKLCYCPLRVDRFVFASSCIDIRKNSDDDDDDGYHICSACLIGFHPLVRFGFFKWAIPASFRLFSSFQINITNFTLNVCEKMSIYLVYGAGIRTHDLQNMSLLPLPLDQDFRPLVCFVSTKILKVKSGDEFKIRKSIRSSSECKNLKVKSWGVK